MAKNLQSVRGMRDILPESATRAVPFYASVLAQLEYPLREAMLGHFDQVLSDIPGRMSWTAREVRLGDPNESKCWVVLLHRPSVLRAMFRP